MLLLTKKNSFLFFLVHLFRPHNWYKNLLVFAALFFSLQIFETELLFFTILGFIIMSIISSAGYIINDVIDIKEDKLHPEKRFRPIASGKIPSTIAIFLGIILYMIGFVGAFFINLNFFYVMIILAFATFLYSIYFKHQVVADILFISVNFVLRALAGVFIISALISPWFLLAIFLFAFFLVLGKRYGDLCKLDKSSKKYKKVLDDYSKEYVMYLLVVVLAGLIVIFGLYAFNTEPVLLFTYPIFMYPLFLYLNYILKEHPAISNPEEFVLKYRDTRLIISSGVFTILVFIILYVP